MGRKRLGGYTFLQPKPLGHATFEAIRFVRYLDTEDAFVVEFESGETYRLSHTRLREANRLPGATGEVDSVWIEAELRSGFLVRYADDTWADCAWDLVKETAA